MGKSRPQIGRVLGKSTEGLLGDSRMVLGSDQ